MMIYIMEDIIRIYSLDNDREFQSSLIRIFKNKDIRVFNDVASLLKEPLANDPKTLCLIDYDLGLEINGLEIIQTYKLDNAILLTGLISHDLDLSKLLARTGIKGFPKDCLQWV